MTWGTTAPTAAINGRAAEGSIGGARTSEPHQSTTSPPGTGVGPPSREPSGQVPAVFGSSREHAAASSIALAGEGEPLAVADGLGGPAYDGMFHLAQLDMPGAAPLTPPQQSDVDAAVERVRELMRDGGLFEDDLTNSELKEIVGILDGLDADSARQVVERLTDEELSTIFGEMKGRGLGGFNGLSGEERNEVLSDLAGKLDAAQFERVARIYGEPEEVAEIVAEHGSREAKVGFVRAYADRASNDPQPGAWYENIGGSTTRYGNEEARAIGTVLASLAGDPEGLRQAIEPLTPDQLNAVVGASMKMTSRQGATPGGATLPVYSFDDTGINAILDAVATSDDPGLKARVFASAAKALQQVQGVDGILTPSVDAGQTATSIAKHMTSLLRSDTRGIVSELETSDATGDAITPWTRQMLAAGRAEELNAVVGDLRNGPHGDAITYLSDRKAAVDLGYMIGGIAAGLHSLQASARDEAALLSKILGLGYGQIPQVGSVVSFASEQLVNQLIGDVEQGTTEAPKALYKLMVEGLPEDIQGWIDIAVGRVIDWQTIGR